MAVRSDRVGIPEEDGLADFAGGFLPAFGEGAGGGAGGIRLAAEAFGKADELAAVPGGGVGAEGAGVGHEFAAGFLGLAEAIPAVEAFAAAADDEGESRPAHGGGGGAEMPVEGGLLIPGAGVEFDDEPAPRAGVVEAAVGSAAVAGEAGGAGHGGGDDESAGVGRAEVPFGRRAAAGGGGVIGGEAEEGSSGEEPVQPVVGGKAAVHAHGRAFPEVGGSAQAIVDRGGDAAAAGGGIRGGPVGDGR